MSTVPDLPVNAALVDIATGKPTILFTRLWKALVNAVAGLAPQQAFVVSVAALPDPLQGLVAFASDGRKAGEGPGLGTGVLAFADGTNWCACDTGATVAA